MASAEFIAHLMALAHGNGVGVGVGTEAATPAARDAVPAAEPFDSAAELQKVVDGVKNMSIAQRPAPGALKDFYYASKVAGHGGHHEDEGETEGEDDGDSDSDGDLMADALDALDPMGGSGRVGQKKVASVSAPSIRARPGARVATSAAADNALFESAADALDPLAENAKAQRFMRGATATAAAAKIATNIAGKRTDKAAQQAEVRKFMNGGGEAKNRVATQEQMLDWLETEGRADDDGDSLDLSVAAAAAAPRDAGLLDSKVGWSFAGIWSSKFPTNLYDARGAIFAGVVPETVAQNGAVPLESADETATLRIKSAVRSVSLRVPLQKVVGLGSSVDAYVYTDVDLEFVRRDFFRIGTAVTGIQTEFTFTDPVRNKTTELSLVPNERDAALLRKAAVWASEPGDTIVVLRFDAKGGENAPLRDVIVMYKRAGSEPAKDKRAAAAVTVSDVDAPAAALDPAEQALLEHALAGCIVDLESVRPAQLLEEASAPYTALSTALATLSHHYRGRVAAFAPLPTTGLAAADHAMHGLLKRYGASATAHAYDAGERGQLLARHIRERLGADASHATIERTMHALGAAQGVYHMAHVRGTPQAATARLNMFLAAQRAVRSDPRHLWTIYF